MDRLVRPELKCPWVAGSIRYTCWHVMPKDTLQVQLECVCDMAPLSFFAGSNLKFVKVISLFSTASRKQTLY